MTKGKIEIEDLEGTLLVLKELSATNNRSYRLRSELERKIEEVIKDNKAANTWRSLNTFEDLKRGFVGLEYLEINQLGAVRWIERMRLMGPDATLEGVFESGHYRWAVKEGDEVMLTLQVFVVPGYEWPMVIAS